ncbi:MAG: YggT family protein [Clostridiales bacterium]|nr:YggT family protein [Clostridiales bacterium]MCF8021336.1 YggT family protein [Clostridiales bacterium]
MLIDFINIAFEVYTWLIIIRIILSWIQVSPENIAIRFIYELTEPVLGFFRRIIPSIGMLDISPIAAVLAIEILRSIVIRVVYLII